jgi:2-polyprenyl-3-methyl-5-hydroxy-6-metoxy-1,4-benzoquinol methylase/glycosyltransferase involved in cell wall biosynthesis
VTFTIGFLIDSIPFTPGVIAGTESLGGSESACLGLARALKARGHAVSIFATKLDEACIGPDQAGVLWHPADELPAMNTVIEFDVFVVLRLYPHLATFQPKARLTLLWHQDLLTDPNGLMAVAWAADTHVYVSDYQRQQYEDRLPELKGHGWVTKNGYDETLVPADVVKDPNRIIHITRPERGLRPILQMWAHLKKQFPQATLALCRYNSMYDAAGWGKVCAQFDEAVEAVNAEVGGITYLGELGKPALYRAIAESAVMWYPGIASFAETSCIAAIEAQANGTPFVGSYKGALPETVPSGVLVKGDAENDADYQRASIDAVIDALKGCANSGFAYRARVKSGQQHVRAYTYDAIAAEWDAFITDTFQTRYAENRVGVLRQLLHYDDLSAADRVAADILEREPSNQEAADIRALYTRVAAGLDQGPADYAERALDPATEIKFEGQQGIGRFYQAGSAFAGCTHVLDMACGNGSMALHLAERYPTLRITGVDYAAGNIAVAQEAAARMGLSDRVTFLCGSPWNLETQQPVPVDLAGPFDGLFVGEFIEHVADCTALVDSLEAYLTPGAVVVYTCPSGPFGELLQRGMALKRGHVHHFCGDDLAAVFGGKEAFGLECIERGISMRGHSIAYWVISYRMAPNRPAGRRPYAHRIVTTRPKARLSVGLIAHNAEVDLGKCLTPLYGLADEILVGDTGSMDATAEIAESYGARVIPLSSVESFEDGFSGARNAVLAQATGEWFMWIDADEWLQGVPNLHKYLVSGPYNGYAISQLHLMLDGPVGRDTPVRIFRTGQGIRFFGCVHEQPGLDDGNTDILPALELSDVSVAHSGYLTESVRKGKMLNRNLPLLKRDQQVFPKRRLGRVLVLRDFYNLGQFTQERADGQLTSKAQKYYGECVRLFMLHFADPADKYHKLARPFYEASLKALGTGFELDYGLGGRQGDMGNHRAKLQRVRVQTFAEYDAIVRHEMARIAEQMHPAPLKTDPFEEPAGVAA